MRDNFDFLQEDKHQGFPQADAILFGGHSHTHQSTQINKFAISLQYLKKEGRAEVDCLPVDKHKTFLRVDTINFGEHGQSWPKYL